MKGICVVGFGVVYLWRVVAPAFLSDFDEPIIEWRFFHQFEIELFEQQHDMSNMV